MWWIVLTPFFIVLASLGSQPYPTPDKDLLKSAERAFKYAILNFTLHWFHLIMIGIDFDVHLFIWLSDNIVFSIQNGIYAFIVTIYIIHSFTNILHRINNYAPFFIALGTALHIWIEVCRTIFKCIGFIECFIKQLFKMKIINFTSVQMDTGYWQCTQSHMVVQCCIGGDSRKGLCKGVMQVGTQAPRPHLPQPTLRGQVLHQEGFQRSVLHGCVDADLLLQVGRFVR